MEDVTRFLNHWWREGKVRGTFAREYKRGYFGELKELLGKRQAIVIHGLRRTGKSTLMFQLIQQLIEDGVPPLSILYFSFDKKVAEAKQVLDAYSMMTEKDYEKERIFVFFDEIYKLKNWHEELKILYDGLPNVKFVVSGSAGLKVEKEARKNLVGRAFYVEVKPLSLSEFLELKYKTNLVKEKVWEDKLKTNFPAFLRKAFPEVVEWAGERVAEYVRELVLDKVIFSDFPSTFKNVDIGLLQTLTEIFFSNPGMYLNMDSLSRDLGKSKKDLIFHTKLLEFGYLIRIVGNYRGSRLSASRKLRRVYPYHPSLIYGVFKDVNESKLVECWVRSHLDAQFYWRKDGKEIDFIHEGAPVEVKYQEKISREGMKNVIEFMNAFGVRKGYVISKDVEDELKIGNKIIKILPAWRFAIRPDF
ncbi:MAG: ATP-binding protein [Candidatus Hadarchaeota archaeon]